MMTKTLNGWKEIARYMGRGVCTVQRWEELGLPVRRPWGHSRSAVVAVAGELDKWLTEMPIVAPEAAAELAELRQRAERALLAHQRTVAMIKMSVRLAAEIASERKELESFPELLRLQFASRGGGLRRASVELLKPAAA